MVINEYIAYRASYSEIDGSINPQKVILTTLISSVSYSETGGERNQCQLAILYYLKLWLPHFPFLGYSTAYCTQCIPRAGLTLRIYCPIFQGVNLPSLTMTVRPSRRPHPPRVHSPDEFVSHTEFQRRLCLPSAAQRQGFRPGCCRLDHGTRLALCSHEVAARLLE